jgi:UDP-N-acetylmuramoyl-L-alanyl-D-glutamate--2,6-diaminopimelate ligase
MSPRRPAAPTGPVLVVGLGRAGQAAAEALVGRGAGQVVAWDAEGGPRLRPVAQRLGRRGADVRLGGDGSDALAAAGPDATVVKSPGVPFNAPILRRAAAAGLEVLDELELGWRLGESPLVGITGTNGKSTTAGLCAAALEAGGHRTRLGGNTEFGLPLSAVGACDWVVCEVSSFQLEAAPSFLPEVAVFTNLTLEHLPRHGSMESYGAVKRRMFVRGGLAAGTSVINVDDPFGRTLAGDVEAAGGRVLRYGFDRSADVLIEAASWDLKLSRLRVRTPPGVVDCVVPAPGRHNARNAAAAVAAGLAAGVAPEVVARALAKATPPPGRWEVVSDGGPFDVIVDYAHTPDGIEQFLRAARAVVDSRPGAQLRAVFGAVGLRDPQKARESGRLLRALTDHLVLTTGTAPGDARVPRLLELLRAGTGGAEVEVVLDRREAIRRAVRAARPGDLVAVLGLGALQRLIVDAAGTVCPFDDRQAAREELSADMGS